MKSWENSSNWYDLIVGKEGHYYHKRVIFPILLKIMKEKPFKKVLDLACGQGVLSRVLPKDVSYTGVDLAKSLIKAAKEYKKNNNHQFLVADVEKKLPITEKDFDYVTMILAFQNIEKRDQVIKNAFTSLKKGGRFFLVLNHPCFRIPRQSHWIIDDKKNCQSRSMDSYMSEQKIPIKTHPSKKNSQITFSYHFPLSSLVNALFKQGFVVEKIEEMCSDKKSTGKKAKMEDRSRREFPLFLLLVAKKG